MRSLPAADTRGDPTLIDVGRVQQAQVLHDLSGPVAASAADFDSDEFGDFAAAVPEAAPSDVEAPAVVSQDTLDEYFDSAPIPGVDLSQTSDRPTRGSGRN